MSKNGFSMLSEWDAFDRLVETFDPKFPYYFKKTIENEELEKIRNEGAYLCRYREGKKSSDCDFLYKKFRYMALKGAVEASKEVKAEKIAEAHCMDVKRINDLIDDPSNRKEAKSLFMGIWNEGEVSALYADTNLGKSILAVQIGDHIARSGKTVVYIDLELSDDGFVSRCSDGSETYRFSDRFHRLTVDRVLFPSYHPDDAAGEQMISAIEDVCKELRADVVIVDNLSAIAENIQSGSTASRLVKRFLQMRDNYGWSILFVAHTPKVDRRLPISRNDMAGSKNIINLLDSAFSIGCSLTNPELRYIKQTKVRYGSYVYNENNVLTATIVRRDGLLQYDFGENTSEFELLMTPQEISHRRLVKQVNDYKADGMKTKEISEILCISEAAVKKIIQDSY